MDRVKSAEYDRRKTKSQRKNKGQVKSMYTEDKAALAGARNQLSFLYF